MAAEAPPGRESRGDVAPRSLLYHSSKAAHRIAPAKHHHSSVFGAAPETYEASHKFDDKRVRNVNLARSTSPLAMWWRVDKFLHTIIPRVFCYWCFWLVILVYVFFASVSRFSYHLVDFGDSEDRTAFDGAGRMITYMIVFYVGYCYSRFSEQYFLMTGTSRLIITCCNTARVALHKDSPDTMRFWRLLNLMNVCCYCGMNDAYNSANLRKDFCEKYKLIESEEIGDRIDAIDPDKMGERAMNECLVWAMCLLDRLEREGKLTVSAYKHLMKDTRTIGQSLGRLNAFQNYVMPFAYSHLISLSSTAFLCGSAALKGLLFKPEASISFGFTLPFLATMSARMRFDLCTLAPPSPPHPFTT